MLSDLHWLSLTELAQLLVSGAASSREIVATYLDRIAALDGHLHAFIEVYRDDALAAAAAADRDQGSRAYPRPDDHCRIEGTSPRHRKR